MAKLGTNSKPAIVRVTSEERASEIYNLCERNGWKVIIGVEPDATEDISDVQRLLGVRVENAKTVVSEVQIGRNDPCLCGSGKKYKKCCIGKEEQVTAKKTIQKLFEAFLTREEVSELSTDEIIHKLREFGIPFEQEAFLRDIEKYYSAEDLSKNWFHTHDVTASGRDEDFPWHAAAVLWERLAPADKLSGEQIEDLLEHGYKYLDNNDYVTACDTWLQVWETIKSRLKPELQSLDDLDKQYKGDFSIKNSMQDLEMELSNAGLKNPAYFEKRITYCREFCSYFPKEDELIRHNMHRAIAESYAELGQYEEAQLEFEKLVQEFPNNPWGYIGWGDMYLFGHRKDYEKARTLYKKGLAIAKDKIDVEVVKERLEELEGKALSSASKE